MNHILLLVAMIGALPVLAVIEILLRQFFKLQNKGRYCVHMPHLRKSYEPMLGISGTAEKIRFHTNAFGIRGKDFSSDQQYRILVMGGSTAECQFIDQKVSWPQILEDRLNERSMLNVWVGNIGRSGASTREFYMYMKYLLPQYPAVDAILVVPSSNDMLRRLIADDGYDPYYLQHYKDWKDRLIRGAFATTPYYGGKFRLRPGYYDETAIGHVYRHLKTRYFQKYPHKNKNAGLLILRQRRRDARLLIDTLPDMASGLSEFRRNLQAIVNMAASRDIRLVFMTQPTLWKKDMTQAEKDLLWSGWIRSMKTGRYYTAETLQKGMRLYNKTLMAFCLKRGIECIDIDRMIKKDKSHYYDDNHLTEIGCRDAASAIFHYLTGAKPFLSGENIILNRKPTTSGKNVIHLNTAAHSHKRRRRHHA